jgi:hypothetical protein
MAIGWSGSGLAAGDRSDDINVYLVGEIFFLSLLEFSKTTCLPWIECVCTAQHYTFYVYLRN